jgi:hypothetical protein
MRRLFAAWVVLLAAGPAAAADYPHVYLTNDKLKVKVYLPDPEKGFYRGTRFDWAGVLGEVEFAGHKLFGPWKDTHDPTNHDDIIGPCEEFGMEKPLGYDEAKPGGTFLKIGVGELEKPDDKPYQFHRKYRIVKPAAWEEFVRDLDAKKAGVRPMVGWRLTASHPSGYGYQYQKAVSLNPADARLTISHRLRNTGTRPITTDFYNHNFFNVDGDPVGPNYRIRFPFEVKAKDPRGRFAELVEVRGEELRFKDKLTDGFVMAGLTGYDAKDLDQANLELRHLPSGVRVRAGHTNYPFAKVNVWGVKTTICPEPFLAIEGLQPGAEKSWSIVYSFSHDPPKK